MFIVIVTSYSRMQLGLEDVHSPCSNLYYGRVTNLKPPKGFCDVKSDTNCDDD